ncbi:MAG TPA: hypothetical protein VEY08_13005, partial [Chloroflexia bacterium]|nr:hypothetical protein [Chloroflexia bacterium]
RNDKVGGLSKRTSAHMTYPVPIALAKPFFSLRFLGALCAFAVFVYYYIGVAAMLKILALEVYAIVDGIGYEIALRSSFRAPSWTTAWEAAACPFFSRLHVLS